MAKQLRTLCLGLSVLTMPMAGAIAQGSAPAVTNFQGATAAPTPADKAPASAAAAASNTTAPGAMGTTVVPGSDSAVAADRTGTTEQRTGGTGGGGASGR